jgi:hypothetical protein
MFRPKLPLAGTVAVILVLCDAALQAQGGALIVRIARVAIPAGQVIAIVADSDTSNPDAATIAVSPAAVNGSFVGRGLDIAAVDGGGKVNPIFKGEIVGLEPAFDRSGRAVVLIRAYDRTHRLDGEPHTRVFTGQTDADILRQLAFDAGLQAESSGPEVNIQHEHVYQHNQSDLDFLMERAALVGYEVVADDTTLHLRRRTEQPPTTVGCRADGVLLKAFSARLSAGGSVSEVTVRGWDPNRQQEIVGRARQRVIALSPSAALIDPVTSATHLGFVEALQTGAAAHGAAAGTLSALTAGSVSAEMAVEGTASLRARARVILEGAGSHFGGEYYVTQASHRYESRSGKRWATLLRLVRADRGLFVLPEVGDEVLVAFEHGDVDRPVIVGSLWDARGTASDSSPCPITRK